MNAPTTTSPRTRAHRVLLGALALALSAGTLASAGGATAEPVGVAVPTASSGRLVGWGANFAGQTNVPTSAVPFTAVAAGPQHALGLRADGTVVGWGNSFGGSIDVPAGLAGRTVTAIAAGSQSSLALTSEGRVVQWGHPNTPQPPAGLADEPVTAIAAGGFHALALTSSGHVVTWGMGMDDDITPPTSLDTETVTAIAASEDNSAAITADGHLVVWGAQSVEDVPPALSGKRVTAVALGGRHALALTSDGHVTAWGANGNGQTSVPASLSSERVTAIAAGAAHSLALTSDGDVFGWGVSGGGDDVPPSLAGHRVAAISGGTFYSVAVVAALSTNDAPTVTGTPQVGRSLTAVPPTYNATPDAFSYQWLADGSPVDGATGPGFTPTRGQRGTAVTVQVTATRHGYDPSTTVSAATAAVAAAPVPAPSAPTAPGAVDAGTVYTPTGSAGVTLTGTGVPGSAVTVREGGRVLGTTTTGADGRWSLAVASLPAGRHAFDAVQSLDGVTSPASSTGSVTVTGLAVSVAKNVRRTTSRHPLVRGRGNPGATITLRTTRGKVLGTTTVRPAGSWSVRTRTLKRGTYKVRATQTIAGQSITSAVVRFRTKARR